MPTSRRPSAATDRLAALAAGTPAAGARALAGTGWVPPVPAVDEVAPARRIALPFAPRTHPPVEPDPWHAAEPDDEAGRDAAVEPSQRARLDGGAAPGAGRSGGGRHRADVPLGPRADAGTGARPGLGAALVPATLRGGRWQVSRRAAAGALLALAVLATTSVLRAGSPGEEVTLVPARATTSSAPGAVEAAGPAGAGGATGVGKRVEGAGASVAGSAAGARTGEGAAPAAAVVPVDGATGPALVVHVVGQVAAPGLVTVAAGSRVADALAAAGGATDAADLTRLNLARPVVDGEQLVVPAPGEVVAAPPGGAPPPAGAGGAAGSAGAEGGVPVDLNRADLATLDTLPGIGPVLAQRILDWRAEHGRFTSVDELGEVSGIGDALLSRLRDAVTV